MRPNTVFRSVLVSASFAILCLAFGAALAREGKAQAAPAQALTNDDVIKMVEAKLGDAVIAAKIRSSQCRFDTSTDALIKLKAAGVSDTVLAAMAEGGAPTPAPRAPAAPPPDPNDPNAEHDPGIYYVRQNPGGRQMTQLEPTAYSGAKTGGVFTSGLTYGIKKAKWKAVIRGARANVRITERTPTFYFYFEQKHGTLSYAGVPSSAYMFGGLSTPSQFTLVRLDPKKDHRELIMGQWSMYGASSGTREKDVVEFDLEKVSPGIYKVVPRNSLEPGEYCFFNTGQGGPAATVGIAGPVGGGGGGGMVFDFGVNPAE
jgi:hypothetical protein